MTEDQQFITQDGLEKIKKELTSLKTIKRREIAERIERAKEMGDLSENAEYIQAKEDQAFNEGRVIELENLVANAVIINHEKSAVINLGSKIRAKYNGSEKEFTIVGSNEADPLAGKISNVSPLGQAFLGRVVGDEVEIEVPAGKVKYKIIEVG